MTLGSLITRIRVIFNFAFDAELLERPVRYGTSFNKPSRKVIRKSKKRNGKRMLEADELRKIINAAGQPLRAMTLLAINGGFGNNDVGSLPQAAVNLENRWIDYPRPETGIERRCPLWPETVHALRDAAEKRPEPIANTVAGLMFLTRRGDCWVRCNHTEKKSWNDYVGLEFGKLLKKLNLKRPGLNFYAIRHTFQTVAEESRDLPAVKHVMGHSDDSMSAVYRERISDELLKAVTDTVHAWLWPKEELED